MQALSSQNTRKEYKRPLYIYKGFSLNPHYKPKQNKKRNKDTCFSLVCWRGLHRVFPTLSAATPGLSTGQAQKIVIYDQFC